MSIVKSKKAKVLLIFPPGWDPRGPYLSLPHLTGFLRQNEVYTKQVDLNIELINELLTVEHLQECYDSIENEIRSLGSSTNGERDNQKLQELLLCRSLYKAIRTEFGDCLKWLKSDFVSPEKYTKARQTIEIASRICSAMYYPWRIQDCSLYYLNQSPRCYDVMQDDLRTAKTISDIEEFLSYPSNPYTQPIETYLDNIFKKEQFDIVGLSVCSYFQMIPALNIAQYVKSKTGSITVMGGAIIQFMTEAIKHNTVLFNLIDLFVNGEGEIPLLNLANSLHDPDFDYSNLEGVIYKNKKSGEVCETQPAPPISIQRVPTPDFDDFDLSKYFSPQKTFSLPIMITKGCYWNKCSFCSLNSNFHSLYRQRPIDMVLHDLDELHRKYGVEHFRFVDNAISPSLLNSLSTALLEHERHYKWICLCRCETKFEKDVWKKAYDAGLRFVSFGIESSSQKMLDLMNKGTDANVISKNLRECSGSGIFIHVILMYNHPGEDAAEYKNTSNFIRQNEKYIHTSSLARFHLDLNTPIFKNPEKYGITINKEALPKDYIWFTCDYDTIDGKKVYNQTLEFKLRDSISDLLCYNQTLGGLDDTYLFNLVFSGESTLLAPWGKKWAEKYTNLKELFTQKQDLEFSSDVHQMTAGENVLLYNAKTGKYWSFPGKNFDIAQLIYNKPENDATALAMLCDIVLDGALTTRTTRESVVVKNEKEKVTEMLVI